MKTNDTITLNTAAGLRNAGPMPQDTEVVGTIGILALIRNTKTGLFAAYAGGVTSSVDQHYVKGELARLRAGLK